LGGEKSGWRKGERGGAGRGEINEREKWRERGRGGGDEKWGEGERGYSRGERRDGGSFLGRRGGGAGEKGEKGERERGEGIEAGGTYNGTAKGTISGLGGRGEKGERGRIGGAGKETWEGGGGERGVEWHNDKRTRRKGWRRGGQSK